MDSVVDAYLQIAISILRIEKRPLSARAILAAAYRYGEVPPYLYGKTQHKTLGARISEDIIARRDESHFFRSQPGRFFLREFITDETIPEEYRQPISTRRRSRDLLRGPALAIDVADLSKMAATQSPISPKRILDLLHSRRYHYNNPKDSDPNSVFLWSFVTVRRQYEILSYRLGRYRDDRDTFMMKRSLGFSTLVHQDQSTLFNVNDFGIVDSGVDAVKVDLDVPQTWASHQAKPLSAELGYFLWIPRSGGYSDLVAVVHFECPSWFHPERRRLALNNLTWLDIRVPLNNIDDFDPWSRSMLQNKNSNFLPGGA